jgi:hypothetical protein
MLKTRPRISNVRLLALNNLYLFDQAYTTSTSRYFSVAAHNAIRSLISFESYHARKGQLCHDWCLRIERSPPADWLSSMTLCAKFLSEAYASKNILDIHTAQVLTSILPVFLNAPPKISLEDSYVHNYLSSLLSSVFSSDLLLNMKWANGQLKTDKAYKPDFLVHNIEGNRAKSL